ncbi:DALR anticodon-binding domain-containing protein, partial [Kaarinaea lacus]
GDVELLDGGESLATSPWSDEFISLREARQEIASDRLRYDCLATHSSDAARILLSDKNKAKELEAIRIAYSKINLQLNAKQHQLDTIEIKNGIDLLSHCNNTDPRERLLQLICKYPEILCRASERWEPSEICDYLLELIHSYEGWHNAGPTDSLNIQEQNAEVVLLFAARKVLTDALQILSLPLVDQK